MRDRPILNIVKSVTPVSANDTVGRAAEAMKAAGTTELPVFDTGRLVGVITEAGVLSALVKQDGSPDAALTPVHTVMSTDIVCGNQHMSVGRAAEVMDEHGVQVLPIVDDYGRILGVAIRQDVNGALTLSMRPPSIAGLATPLGVYLTTGHVRAGASDMALFLAGVSLMLLNYLAIGLVAGLAWGVEHTLGFKLWTILLSTSVGPPWAETARSIMIGLSIPLFLVLLRVAALSGYHAAEHQVVHAIERGEPLKPEIVSRMPRVHPRCGTNIVAAVVLFFLVSDLVSLEVVAMITIFVMVFAWRVIGAYFQHYITTKPANRKQLESGIRAGESLLEQYRENPARQVTGWRRVWNTGMPQVMLGAASMTSVGELLHRAAPTLF